MKAPRKFHWSHAVFALLILPIITLADLPAATQSRLRELALLPTVEILFGFNFHSAQGFIPVSEDPDQLSIDLDRVESKLQGNPNDPELLCEVGRLRSRLGDNASAKTAFDRAVELLREPAKNRQQDALVQRQYGKALEAAGSYPEADAAFRKATALEAKDWRNWLALGNSLRGRALRLLCRDDKDSVTVVSSSPAAFKPSPEQVRDAKKLLAEVDVCFDRAIAVAPTEAEIYTQRAMHHSLLPYMKLRMTDHPEAGGNYRANKEMFSENCIADLKEAARLNPTNYFAIVLAASWELFAPVAASGQTPTADDLKLDRKPQLVQNHTREAISQLETLARSADQKQAAGACEMLGILRFMIAENDAAEASFRRALELDPTRFQAWEAMIGFAVNPGRTDELVALCEKRLKFRDTARNHLLLAKAYDRAKKPDKTMQQVQLAVRMKPNDPLATLALATLQLRVAEEKSAMDGAGKSFALANELAKKMPQGKERNALQMRLALNLSIYSALNGDVAKAREILNAILKTNPKQVDAEKILGVVNTAFAR